MSVRKLVLGIAAASVICFIAAFVITSMFLSASSAPVRAPAAVKDKRLPPIVRLHFLPRQQFFCSGTVISDYLILTAAHCVSALPIAVPIISVQLNSTAFPSILASVLGFWEGSDQALLYGDFSAFSHMGLITDTATDMNTMLSTRKLVACGYPWGGPLFCCPITERQFYNFKVSGKGYLFPGMSGGPVIDVTTGEIVAVNTAVMGDRVILSPTLGLFDNIPDAAAP